MPQPQSDHPMIDGFEELMDVPASALSSIKRDLETNPTYVRSLINELALTNPKLAMAILCLARNQGGDDKELEAAYLKGAMTVIGALVKKERTRKLTENLMTGTSGPVCSSCPA